jgi:hypothetical protein
VKEKQRQKASSKLPFTKARTLHAIQRPIKSEKEKNVHIHPSFLSWWGRDGHEQNREDLQSPSAHHEEVLEGLQEPHKRDIEGPGKKKKKSLKRLK